MNEEGFPPKEAVNFVAPEQGVEGAVAPKPEEPKKPEPQPEKREPLKAIDPSLNLYQRLGVANTATLREIRSAIKRKSRENHADVIDPEYKKVADDNMVLVNETRILLDPVERRAYDESLIVAAKSNMPHDDGSVGVRVDLWGDLLTHLGQAVTGNREPKVNPENGREQRRSSGLYGIREHVPTGKYYIQIEGNPEMYSQYFNSHDKIDIIGTHAISWDNEKHVFAPIDVKTGRIVGNRSWSEVELSPSGNLLVLKRRGETGVGLYNGQRIESFSSYRYEDGLHIAGSISGDCVLDPVTLQRFSIRIGGYNVNTFSSIRRDPNNKEKVIVTHGARDYYLN